MAETLTRAAGLWQRARAPALVTATLALATLVMTYPVAFTLGSRLPGWPGDSHEYLWKVWYFKHALVDEGRWPVFAPEVFYPFGLDLVTATELTPLTGLLALPFTLLFGAVTSYTLVALASFVLSGLGAALIVRSCGGSWAAGLVAGLAFAFTDYRMQRLGGHLNLTQTQWPVFAFYFTERWLQKGSPGLAALAGLMLTLAAYASAQYLLALALLLPVYALVRGWPWPSRLRERRILVGLAVGMLALAPALPLVAANLGAEASGLSQHTFGEMDSYPVWPVDYVLPEPHHPAAGLLKGLLPGLELERTHSERTAYLSLAALALATLGVSAQRNRRPALAFLAVGLFAATLAFGPTLHGPGGRVYVDLPPALAQTLVRAGVADLVESRLSADLAANLRAGRAFVPTPATALVLSGRLEAFRGWGRLAGFAALAVAVLAGLGADRLIRALGRRRRAGVLLALALSALVLADQLWLPFPTFEARPRAVDLWLAAQPGDFAVMHYPGEASYSGISVYGSAIHGKKLTYGYATFLPLAYRPYLDTLERFPAPETLSLLASWQVKYVLVTPAAYHDGWAAAAQAIAAAPRLRLVGELDGIQVYELLAETMPSVSP